MRQDETLQHSLYCRVLLDNALYSLFAIIPIVIGQKLPFNRVAIGPCRWQLTAEHMVAVMRQMEVTSYDAMDHRTVSGGHYHGTHVHSRNKMARVDGVTRKKSKEEGEAGT